MRRKPILRKQKLEKGDFIFLKGRLVIAKWEVMEIVDGKAHLKIVGETHKTFIHNSDEFIIGKNLWLRGLRAYPYNSLYDRDWQAFQAKKDMLGQMKELIRIQGRLNKIQSSKKILSCMDILTKTITDLRLALRKSGNRSKLSEGNNMGA